MKKDKATNLQARVERKRSIQEKIADIRRELSTPRIWGMAAKLMASGDARSRLASFINVQGGGSESGVSAARRSDLVTLKSNAEQTAREFKEVEAEKERLTAELEALQGELATLDCTAEVADIAAHQVEIDKAKEVVAALSKTIAEQQEIISGNQVAGPKDLQRRRQDILADKAMGKADRDFATELQAVDEEISDLDKKAASAKRTVADAQHAMEGLSRKLTEAQAAVKALEDDHKEMVGFFLKTEATMVDLEYQALTLMLRDSYCQLSALSSILGQHFGGEEAFFNGGLPQLNTLVYDIPAAINQEKARLGAMGIQC